MELAESVGGKTPSYMKPETFDPKFGDSTYLGTDMAKSRLRGYMRTFGYMMFCGLLLLIGGGTFFIYESFVINQLPTSDQPGSSVPSGRSAPAPDAYLVKDKIHYSKEFQIIAFVFIGVGAILFVIGAPLATQFYRRYKYTKDSERSPILDPLDKKKESKSKTVNALNQPESSNQTLDSCSSASTSKKKKIYRGKRKSKGGWMYKSKKNFAQEGFRFAAHRHPSMNQITIDSSGFFDRRISENSSEGSDDNIPEISDSPRMTPKSPSFMNFISKIFGRNDKEKDSFKHTKMEDNIDSPIERNFDETYEEIDVGSPGSSGEGILDNRFTSETTNDRSTYGVNPSFESGQDFPSKNDGLYNLQE